MSHKSLMAYGTAVYRQIKIWLIFHLDVAMTYKTAEKVYPSSEGELQASCSIFGDPWLTVNLSWLRPYCVSAECSYFECIIIVSLEQELNECLFSQITPWVLVWTVQKFYFSLWWLTQVPHKGISSFMSLVKANWLSALIAALKVYHRQVIVISWISKWVLLYR